MRPFFSIVVIACNVGKYLPQCLDSIAAQTFRDFNVIIGVEESSDNTLEISQSFAQNYKNFRVETFPRSGSASAIRNFGIDRAEGKYLLFVDGDDWIEPDSLQKFRDKILEFDSLDVVAAAAQVWLEHSDGTLTKGESIFPGNYPDAVFTGAQYLVRVCPITKLRTATWMAAYSADFLRVKKIYQPYGRRHQDDDWTPRVFVAAERVAAMKFAYYNYRKRAGSITTTPTPKSLSDVADNIVSQFDFWRSGAIAESLKPSFATWYTDYVMKFFYGKYSAKLRGEYFMKALSPRENYVAFCDIAGRATMSKRIFIPICTLARLPKCFPLADFIFKYLYAPLVYGKWRRFFKRI